MQAHGWWEKLKKKWRRIIDPPPFLWSNPIIRPSEDSSVPRRCIHRLNPLLLCMKDPHNISGLWVFHLWINLKLMQRWWLLLLMLIIKSVWFSCLIDLSFWLSFFSPLFQASAGFRPHQRIYTNLFSNLTEKFRKGFLALLVYNCAFLSVFGYKGFDIMKHVWPRWGHSF